MIFFCCYLNAIVSAVYSMNASMAEFCPGKIFQLNLAENRSKFWKFLLKLIIKMESKLFPFFLFIDFLEFGFFVGQLA